jgi:hypothetical protein
MYMALRKLSEQIYAHRLWQQNDQPMEMRASLHYQKFETASLTFLPIIPPAAPCSPRAATIGPAHIDTDIHIDTDASYITRMDASQKSKHSLLLYQLC